MFLAHLPEPKQKWLMILGKLGGLCGMSTCQNGPAPVLVVCNLANGGFSKTVPRGLNQTNTSDQDVHIKHGLSLHSSMAHTTSYYISGLWFWPVQRYWSINQPSPIRVNITNDWNHHLVVCVVIYSGNKSYMRACLPQWAVLCQSQHVYFS